MTLAAVRANQNFANGHNFNITTHPYVRSHATPNLTNACIFETQISKGLLRTRLKHCAQAETTISPEKVRLCFDLISELYANAIKFGRPGKSRVMIWPCKENGFSGFAFTTLTLPKEVNNFTVPGERYASVTDAIFREGNSGLPKITALAASLAGHKIELSVRQTKNAFNVFVPLFGSL